MYDSLAKLNTQQLEAVSLDVVNGLIVAGAGSGKTTVLIYRIIYLINEIGLNPQKILAITFTNKAANEIKERIKMISSSFSLKWIGTFHSICLRILREDIGKIGRDHNFTIIDTEEQLSIVKELYAKLGINKDLISHKVCLNFVNQLKSNQIDEADVINALDSSVCNDERKDVIKKIYLEYQEYLVEKNLFDFDDLIIYTLKLFNSDLAVLKKWQDQFDYILVDEFQDTNFEQYELIKLLSKNKNNVFVVGDPDQMIYSWRGAYQNIFNDFIDEFADVKTVILNKNYRSTKAILAVSNQLINNNSSRIKKELFTDNVEGNKVLYFKAPCVDKESNWIVNKIRLLINNKYEYKEIAILYRSNYLSRNIEQKLIRAGIPYHIFGGLKFYQRKEIKDILAYFKLICNNDDLALSRIYNTPKRKISENTLTKIKEYAYEKDLSLFDTFDYLDKIDLSNATKNACNEFKDLIYWFKNQKFNSLVDLFDAVLNKTKYIEMLKENNEDNNSENRIENLNELRKGIQDFEIKNINSSLIDYLQEISLYTDLESNNKNYDKVTLMTVHTSKGLEFKNVFLFEFNEGDFPSAKSINEKKEMEEERRIAYVAMTRAKENLFISSSDGSSFAFAEKQDKVPSRFLNEIIKNKYLEVISETYKPLFSETDDVWYNSNADCDYDQFFHKNNPEFEIGDSVVHTSFGSGIITSIKNDMLDIVFKAPYGSKTIMKNHKSIKRKLS